jgi:hypothetical protein
MIQRRTFNGDELGTAWPKSLHVKPLSLIIIDNFDVLFRLVALNLRNKCC